MEAKRREIAALADIPHRRVRHFFGEMNKAPQERTSVSRIVGVLRELPANQRSVEYVVQALGREEPMPDSALNDFAVLSRCEIIKRYGGTQPDEARHHLADEPDDEGQFRTVSQ